MRSERSHKSGYKGYSDEDYEDHMWSNDHWIEVRASKISRLKVAYFSFGAVVMFFALLAYGLIFG